MQVEGRDSSERGDCASLELHVMLLNDWQLMSLFCFSSADEFLSEFDYDDANGKKS